MSYENDKKIFKDEEIEEIVDDEEAIEDEDLIMTKLSDYLDRTNCSEEDIEEIFDDVDIIIKNNVDDLDKIEEFIDKADNKALYDGSYIKEFMSDLASKYSNNSSDLGEGNNNSEKIEDEEESIEDEEIEEVTERNKKGIINWFKDKFSKKEKKDKKTPKIVALFKNFFKKKDDIELEDEEIEEVTERNKKGIISRFKDKFTKKKENKNTKKVENTKEENKIDVSKPFEDLSLNEKLFKYLEGVTYTWKDLANIVNKIAKISENEEQVERLNEFFNDNKNLDLDKRVVALIYEIVDIMKEKNDNLINPQSEDIKKFFAANKLDTIPEVTSLYNSLILSDDNISELYSYIVNNIEKAKDANNILDKMNEILGKALTNNATKSATVKKDSKEENKIVSENVDKDSKEESKIVSQNIDKNSKEESKSGNKAKILYDRYNKLQELLSDKYDELEFLKKEYRNIEKSIYGKKPNKLSIEKKRNILLVADKEKLQLLKEKLGKIKTLEQDIDILILKIRAYYAKYGIDVKSAYEQEYSNDYNNAVLLKEREERMNESLDLYNQFNDEEITAIYKYMNYTKGL